ncbi:hypothetical protein MicloDRAFT_00031760 [Microvirga lotononidis]|uniref:Uncharacterized protein n=1 Tax=Microvirga lotononidis TaxID=864069 RepID=I4YRN5_9HYPH|nr:hypothetical protein MicloDRAFT_00031760 [Microvirga lotononidis]
MSIWFKVAAVFQIRATVERIEHVYGPLDQAFSVEAPFPILSGSHGFPL